MDFDAPMHSEELIQILTELEGLCERFQYLGSYHEVI
jgi:hypothetical protein